MFFPLASPRRGIRGRFGNDPYTFVVRNDTCYVRREGLRVDPRTPAQQAMRAMWGEMKKDWSRVVSEPQRRAWQAWGMKHLIAPGLARSAGSAGFHAYPKVEQYRRVLGVHPGGDAPAGGLPGPIIRVVQEAASEDGIISFRIEHKQAQWEGMVVQVETSKAMPTLNRKPREWELHWAAGISAQSFVPLQQSGGLYTFSGGVDAIAAGQRFGLRLRIVSGEGVPGPPIQLDWIKQNAADAATLQTPVSTAAVQEVVAIKPAIRVSRAEKQRARRASEARRQVRLERLHCWWDAHAKLYGSKWFPPWYELEKRRRRRWLHVQGF